MTTKTNHEVTAAVGFAVRETTVERLVRAGKCPVSVTGRLTTAHAERFAALLTEDERDRLRAEEAVGLADLPDAHRAGLLAALDTDGPAFTLTALDTLLATGAPTLAQAERDRKAEAARIESEKRAEAQTRAAAEAQAERAKTQAEAPALRAEVSVNRALRTITEDDELAIVRTLHDEGVTAARSALVVALDRRKG